MDSLQSSTSVRHQICIVKALGSPLSPTHLLHDICIALFPGLPSYLYFSLCSV